MKFIFLMTVTIFSLNIFAQNRDFSQQKLLEVLISNSSDVNVLNNEGSEISYKNLPELLASHILINGNEASTMTCDNGDGAAGSLYIGCKINLRVTSQIIEKYNYSVPDSSTPMIVLNFVVRYSNVSEEYSVFSNRAHISAP